MSVVAQVNVPKVKVIVATSSELQCYLHLCGESYMYSIQCCMFFFFCKKSYEMNAQRVLDIQISFSTSYNLTIQFDSLN